VKVDFYLIDLFVFEERRENGQTLEQQREKKKTKTRFDHLLLLLIKSVPPIFIKSVPVKK